MNINQYMLSQYRDGGRGEIERGVQYFDCWGLVRAIRHDIFNLPLMPEWGLVDPSNKRQVTSAWHKAETLLNRSDIAAGAIACVFHGNVLLHVGIVIQGDRGLSVMETAPESGPRILPILKFESEHCKNRMHVEYWT